jgi:hypothetical protein
LQARHGWPLLCGTPGRDSAPRLKAPFGQVAGRATLPWRTLRSIAAWRGGCRRRVRAPEPWRAARAFLAAVQKARRPGVRACAPRLRTAPAMARVAENFIPKKWAHPRGCAKAGGTAGLCRSAAARREASRGGGRQCLPEQDAPGGRRAGRGAQHGAGAGAGARLAGMAAREWRRQTISSLWNLVFRGAYLFGAKHVQGEPDEAGCRTTWARGIYLGRSTFKEKPAGANPAGRTPAGRNPLGRRSARQSLFGHNPAGRNPFGHNPLGRPALRTKHVSGEARFG